MHFLALGLKILGALCLVGAVVAFFGLGHTPAGWLTLLIVGVIALAVGFYLDRGPVGPGPRGPYARP